MSAFLTIITLTHSSYVYFKVDSLKKKKRMGHKKMLFLGRIHGSAKGGQRGWNGRDLLDN